jgi:hypothetical protein
MVASSTTLFFCNFAIVLGIEERPTNTAPSVGEWSDMARAQTIIVFLVQLQKAKSFKQREREMLHNITCKLHTSSIFYRTHAMMFLLKEKIEKFAYSVCRMSQLDKVMRAMTTFHR